MPVISVPCNSSVTVLTCSRAMITPCGGVFNLPSVRGVEIESNELAAYLRGQEVFLMGYSGYGSCVIVSMGYDSVLRFVHMRKADDRVAEVFKRLSPRMLWLVKYKAIMQRRTALAMAFHSRLGERSAVGLLGGGGDVLRMIMNQL